jgi:arabinan endo-1,5-alpha-L-arabinosidase
MPPGETTPPAPGRGQGEGVPSTGSEAVLCRLSHPWLAVASIGLLLLHNLVTATAQDAPPAPAVPSPDAILQSRGKIDVRVHDPSSIVRCKGDYWMFSTGNGITAWRAPDLKGWAQIGRVFTNLPPWVPTVAPSHRGHFWAPDVIHHEGRYWLYYSVSKFGVNTSAIALATNPTLDPADPAYRWTDHGIVIQSGQSDNFNAIDPAVLATESGDLWMAFGSFWSGIKLIQLDPTTGLRLSPKSPLHSLAQQEAIEAPHIHHHEGYYYLFVNWGFCCRGVDSTYNIRIGRSPVITGPYLDQNGRDLLQDGGTLLLDTDGPFIGPGHANVLREGDRYWFSCHFYDGTDRGRSRLAIVPLTWTPLGWPVIHPYSAR